MTPSRRCQLQEIIPFMGNLRMAQKEMQQIKVVRAIIRITADSWILDFEICRYWFIGFRGSRTKIEVIIYVKKVKNLFDISKVAAFVIRN